MIVEIINIVKSKAALIVSLYHLKILSNLYIFDNNSVSIKITSPYKKAKKFNFPKFPLTPPEDKLNLILL